MAAKAAPAPTAPDPRRITEADPDFQRVKAYWRRRLVASLRAYVADVRRGGELVIGPAQSAFIHRHVALLQAAYLAAHKEGQRDYWGAVSNRPDAWARRKRVEPARGVVQRRLLYYGAASVAKLAREVAVVWRIDHNNKARTAPAGRGQTRDSSALRVRQRMVTLADPPPDLELSRFTAWAEPRVALQADITWSGFQDGYLDAASADAAGLKLQLWWDLEPAAQHCDQCPQIAAGSPYDAPGSGLFGGNELAQSPGDGRTDCGAACKCSLRYGWTDVASGQELVTPADVAPALPEPEPEPLAAQPDIAGSAAALEATFTPPPAPVRPEYAPAPEPASQSRPRSSAEALDQTFTPPPRGFSLDGLTGGQKDALDLLRSVVERWDQVRGGLPPFDAFADPDSPALNLWRDVDWETLTDAQKALLKRYFDALGMWADSSPAWWGFTPEDAGGDLPGQSGL